MKKILFVTLVCIWSVVSMYAWDRNILISTKNTSLLFAAQNVGDLRFAYYGDKITPDQINQIHDIWAGLNRPAYPTFGSEYSSATALQVVHPDGNMTLDLIVKDVTTKNVENGEQTVVTLRDKHYPFEVKMNYKAYNNSDIIEMWAEISHAEKKAVVLKRFDSGCMPIRRGDVWISHLHGSWIAESDVTSEPLKPGMKTIKNMDGARNGQGDHAEVMFSLDGRPQENTGRMIGAALCWSGNYKLRIDTDNNYSHNFLAGINDEASEYKLEPKEVFVTPKLAFTYSEEGLSGVSRNFHRWARNGQIHGGNKLRDILLNSWEGVYFDIDEQKMDQMMGDFAAMGGELFVMDDGWFGHRDSDNSSLGDWFVYEKKLKGGLKYLVDEVNKLGMKFGIWFEPEMISPDSELYKAHPDWAIQIKGRPLTLCREQYVLDYSRKEVRDHVYGMMKKILDSANIEYIKWDMNRQLTEVGSATLPAERQRELWHRYVLGVYDLMARLTTDYPHILLENCSGGGARFDPGLLYYSPQIWCSDDTDAIERLKIQHGTSMCYPCSAMGAHVSDCPNHTVGRNTPFKTRGHVAMVGTFGYELDVTRIPQEDRDAIPAQIEEFNKFNKLVRTGDHYRIGNMFEDNTWDAWEFVAKDKSEALFEFVQVLGRPNERSRRIKLKGLEADAYYYEENEPDKKISGAALMNAGINIAKMWNGDGLYGDFCSKILHFIKV